MPQNDVRVLIEAEVGRAIQNIRAFERGASQSFSRLQRRTAQLERIGRAATIGLTLPIVAAGVAFVRAAADTELLQASFETMLRSASRARDLFADLIEFSAATPFDLQTIARSTQQLLAFGTAQENVIDRLRALGDLSLGNAAKLDRLTAAYGKLRARGRATLEEINQFLEAGVPLLTALADQFGVAESEVLALITAGRVGFAEVDRAITDLTSGTGQFAGGLQRASQTLSGQLSTLKDNVSLAGQEIVRSLIPAIKDVTGLATSAAQGFGGLDQGTQKWILAISGALAVLPLLATRMSLVVAALKALGPLIATPTGAVIVGLGLLATGIAAVARNARDAQRRVELLAEASEGLADDHGFDVRTLRQTYQKLQEELGFLTAGLGGVTNSRGRIGGIEDQIGELEALLDDLNERQQARTREQIADLQAELDGLRARAEELPRLILTISQALAEAEGRGGEGFSGVGPDPLDAFFVPPTSSDIADAIKPWEAALAQVETTLSQRVAEMDRNLRAGAITAADALRGEIDATREALVALAQWEGPGGDSFWLSGGEEIEEGGRNIERMRAQLEELEGQLAAFNEAPPPVPEPQALSAYEQALDQVTAAHARQRDVLIALIDARTDLALAEHAGDADQIPILQQVVALLEDEARALQDVAAAQPAPADLSVYESVLQSVVDAQQRRVDLQQALATAEQQLQQAQRAGLTEEIKVRQRVVDQIRDQISETKNLGQAFEDFVFQVAGHLRDLLSSFAQVAAQDAANQLELLRRNSEKASDVVREAQRKAEDQYRDQERALQEQLENDLIKHEDYATKLEELRLAREAGYAAESEAYKEAKNEQLLAEHAAQVQAFHFRRASALVDIAINTARAVVNALAGIPPPFNIAAAIAAGVAGATQAVIVLAQQPPSPPELLQHGGIVTRPTSAIIGEAGPEAVIPLDRLDTGGERIAVYVTVQGSVIAEDDLADTISRRLQRLDRRGRLRTL